MTDYAVSLTDRLGNPLGQVPANGLSYERRLGGGGSAQFAIRLDHPVISGVNRGNLDTWATEADVLRNGVPVFSGPVIGLDATGDRNTIAVQAASATQWLTRREVRRDLVFAAVDQSTILSTLVAYAQSAVEKGPNADVRLAVSAPPSGIVRDRTYLGAERKGIYDAVQELAAVTSGFDLTLDLLSVGGQTLRTLTARYPYAGSVIDVPLVLGRGGLTGLTVKRPGDPVATRVSALGNGEGSSQVTALAVAAASIEAKYGVHEATLSNLDVKEAATLLSQAGDRLRMGTPPLQIVGAGYKVTPSTPYRLAGLGDLVRVLASRGWIQVDTYLRVVAEKVTVAASGAEAVELTMNDPIAA